MAVINRVNYNIIFDTNLDQIAGQMQICKNIIGSTIKYGQGNRKLDSNIAEHVVNIEFSIN